MSASVKYFIILWLSLNLSCVNDNGNEHEGHASPADAEVKYVCPMPQDSFSSNKPGNCPKCGMELVKVEDGSHVGHTDTVSIEIFLKPTNEFIISSIPVTTVVSDTIERNIHAIGRVEYDPRAFSNISARISGRIEKLYVRYEYQLIQKGQKILDIYSPELLTAQQNLLFVARNDPQNQSLLKASKQRLLLLGLTTKQVDQILETGKPIFSVSVFSPYTGHIHRLANDIGQMRSDNGMSSAVSYTQPLDLKEGMYVTKGQSILKIYDADKALVLLNVYSDDISSVKPGQRVSMYPESSVNDLFYGKVDFIGPFFREGLQTAAVRVYFNNSSKQIPIGSQIHGQIHAGSVKGNWLPRSSVITIGMEKIVFIKFGDGFKAKKITAGEEMQDKIRVISGLIAEDQVAVRAQYLTDSESFIKVQ